MATFYAQSNNMYVVETGLSLWKLVSKFETRQWKLGSKNPVRYRQRASSIVTSIVNHKRASVNGRAMVLECMGIESYDSFDCSFAALGINLERNVSTKKYKFY